MNINEQFLLKILDHTDYVQCSKDTEKFYFEPKGFNVEVKIPYSHSSTQINIHFHFENFEDNKSNNETINFSFDSPNEISEFMFQLYKKYELTLNDGYPTLPKAVINEFESMLKESSDIIEIDKSAHLKKSNGKENYYIDIGESAFSFEKRLKHRPLSPLIIPCYYSKGDVETAYKKVVPCYLAHDYPSLALITKVDPVVKNVQEFSAVLESLKISNPKSASILNALILDTELGNNPKVKTSKPKL